VRDGTREDNLGRQGGKEGEKEGRDQVIYVHMGPSEHSPAHVGLTYSLNE